MYTELYCELGIRLKELCYATSTSLVKTCYYDFCFIDENSKTKRGFSNFSSVASPVNDKTIFKT